MREQVATGGADALLLPFLRAADGPEAERLLARLVSEEAGPIIRGIVGGKLREAHAGGEQHQGQDVEDVCGEAVVRLLARLRELRGDPESGPVGDFRGYVATIAYNACHSYLRRKYPQRWRLKNRLRYLLTHHEGFALWEEGGEWLCGHAGWHGRKARALTADLGEQMQLRRQAAAQSQPAEMISLLRSVFDLAGAPVGIDELVGVVADWQGIKDEVGAESLDERVAGGASWADPRADVAGEVERRLYLQRLWAEIVELPERQRAALLLNLRDLGGGVIALLPLSGVATVRQIAEAVSLPAEQFARLWPELPIEDAAIADLLGVTRQRVINLRKSARERLARRMRPFAGADRGAPVGK